jgi:hypothetical protein
MHTTEPVSSEKNSAVHGKDQAAIQPADLAVELEVERARLRTKTRWWLALLTVAGLGATVFATLGARFLAAGNAVAAATCIAPAVALVLLTFGQLVVILVYGEKIRVKGFTIETEREARELERAGGKTLGPFMAFSHRQMTRFECVALTQAKVSHTASLLAAALGFVVLVVGAWVTFTRGSVDDTVTGAVMTGVGTALSGFLSVTFLRTFRITSEQMSYYYGQPLVNCYLLHAERLLERCGRDLGVDQRREDVQEVIRTILDAASAAQSHLLDRDAQRIPRRRRLRQTPQPRIDLPLPSLNGASQV